MKLVNVATEINKEFLTAHLRSVNWNRKTTNQYVRSANHIAAMSKDINQEYLCFRKKHTFSELKNFKFFSHAVDLHYLEELNTQFNHFLSYQKKFLFGQPGKTVVFPTEKTIGLLAGPIDKQYFEVAALQETFQQKLESKKAKEDELLRKKNGEVTQDDLLFTEALSGIVEEVLDEVEARDFSIYRQQNQLKKYRNIENEDFFDRLKDQDSSLKPSFLSAWPEVKLVIKSALIIDKASTFLFDLKSRPQKSGKIYKEWKINKSASKHETALSKLFFEDINFKYAVQQSPADLIKDESYEDINIRPYSASKDPFIDVPNAYLNSEINILHYFLDQYENVYFGDEPDTEEEFLSSVKKIKKSTSNEDIVHVNSLADEDTEIYEEKYE